MFGNRAQSSTKPMLHCSRGNGSRSTSTTPCTTSEQRLEPPWKPCCRSSMPITGADIDVMRTNYRTILAEKTSLAFVDGRASREHRKERFEAWMKGAQIVCDSGYLEALADVYQDALSQALCLNPGAVELLRLLKSMDKRTIMITEGPEDAHTWTIQRLGIRDMITFTATTNRFGVSKVDGLLEKVMQRLDVVATDVVRVGDSWQRDIEPVMKANVYAIHYAKDENIFLDQMPIRVNRLCNIHAMVEGPSQK